MDSPKPTAPTHHRRWTYRVCDDPQGLAPLLGCVYQLKEVQMAGQYTNPMNGPNLMDQYWWTQLPVILRSWEGGKFTFVLRKGRWMLISDGALDTGDTPFRTLKTGQQN